MPLSRIAGTVLAVVIAAHAARADDLMAFNAAVEDAAAHNRAALGYLRAENLDLAALELTRLREAWGTMVAKYGPEPPAVFRGNPHYTTVFVDVQTRIVGALLVLNLGRADVAASSLNGIRKELSEMRRASGVEVLADCVLDANTTMAALLAARALDLAAAEAGDFAAKVTAVGIAVKRCDAMAPAEIHSNSEFRRLLDGIAAALPKLSKAVAARDRDLVKRLLSELRAFDDRLTLRFG
jgi:hypothetical protein